MLVANAPGVTASEGSEKIYFQFNSHPRSLLYKRNFFFFSGVTDKPLGAISSTQPCIPRRASQGWIPHTEPLARAGPPRPPESAPNNSVFWFVLVFLSSNAILQLQLWGKRSVAVIYTHVLTRVWYEWREHGFTAGCVQPLKIAQEWEYGVDESVSQGAGTQLIPRQLGLLPTSHCSLVGLQLPIRGGKTFSVRDTGSGVSPTLPSFQRNSSHLTVED